MAVDVNTVYRTVLLIINKEQRGYLTPDEFNRTAAQVQLEIFNEYFEDLNQQLRIPENDSEYANRVKNIEQKIAIFQEGPAVCPYALGVFSLPGAPEDFYKLGTVIYKDEKEVQYVQPHELLELNLSPITKPSTYWPVYTYNNFEIKVYPTTINQNGIISCTYIRKPANPEWNFTFDANYTYAYNAVGSQNFELHPTEQTNIITRILLYSGIIIKDPQIVQAAAQQVQNENVNSKS